MKAFADEHHATQAGEDEVRGSGQVGAAQAEAIAERMGQLAYPELGLGRDVLSGLAERSRVDISRPCQE